ncbi:MAG: HNH endonuclease [Pontiellaceae bacterium]|nr:HNH endonuclease [Pontiellaceae bacterium]
MIDTAHFSRALTERFGLAVEAEASLRDDGQLITISPSGIEHTISFKIELHLGWRTVSATFIPGNYASVLVEGMRAASHSQRAAFAVFSDSLKSKGARISLDFGGLPADASSPESWPEDWSSFHLSMRKVGVVIEKSTGYDFDVAFPWATGFFGLAVALLPLEGVDEVEVLGECEGAALLRLVKQYERSRINRAACIEIHGSTCKICGFDFGMHFGDLGDGFIHVHHIVSLADMRGSYALNPGADLIPVCPNCHAMLHRRHPPLTPDELRDLMPR